MEPDTQSAFQEWRSYYGMLRVASEAGGVALLIDAKNDRVAAWYASYGAIPLRDTPHSLILPFTTLHKALIATGKL